MNISNPRTISVRDILYIFFTKIHVFIGIFSTIILLTLLYALTADPVYKTGASVLVKPYFDSTRQFQQYAALSVAPVKVEDLNSEISIMYSDEVLRRVARELNMAEPVELSSLKQTLIKMGISYPQKPMDRAVSYLRRGLSIYPITMSNVIGVEMEGGDPEGIAEVINTLLQVYIDRHIEVQKSGDEMAFYARQIEISAERLAAAEKALEAFQKKWGILDVERQTDSNITLLRVLSERLSLIRSEVSLGRQKIAQIERGLEQTGEFTAMIKEYRDSQSFSDLIREYAPLIREKERIHSLYPETAVESKEIDRQLEGYREEMRRHQHQILEGLRYDLRALEEQQKTLENEIAKIEAESRIIAAMDIEKQRLLMELTQSREIFKLYKDKAEEAQIQESKNISRVSNVTVNSWAYPPSKPSAPKKTLMMALAVFMGSIIGIGCTFGTYYLDHTVKTPEELVRNGGIPALASLGTIKA